MVNFIEVLTNYQEKNMNKINAEIGKELETFNNNLTAWKKAKSRTGIAKITINPYKTKARGGQLQLSSTPETPLKLMLVKRVMILVNGRKPLTWERVKRNA